MADLGWASNANTDGRAVSDQMAGSGVHLRSDRTLPPLRDPSIATRFAAKACPDNREVTLRQGGRSSIFHQIDSLWLHGG
jgi:hypothetical protein